jgi:hypothetical protein
MIDRVIDLGEQDLGAGIEVFVADFESPVGGTAVAIVRQFTRDRNRVSVRRLFIWKLRAVSVGKSVTPIVEHEIEQWHLAPHVDCHASESAVPVTS